MKLNLKGNISRDFDKVADSYDEHAIIQRKAAQHLFSLTRSHIKSDSVVLDAGCGTGYFHELLRKHKIYCPLFQTDISYNMCKKSDDYSSPPEYGGTYTFLSDIESLPFGSDSLDMFFSSLTVQWTDIAKVLGQAFTTLKPNGKLAIATIGHDTLFELKRSSQQLERPLYINDNFIDEDKLRGLCIKAGFKDVQVSVQSIKAEHINIKQLLTSIKGVGASYKADRDGKYLGRDYFNKLEDSYRKNFSSENKLIASWNIIYATATK